MAAMVVFFLAMLFTRESEDDSANVNVNVSSKRQQTASRSSTDETDDRQTVTVPPTSTGVPVEEPQVSTVPGTQTGVARQPADKASVVIDARVTTRTGQPQPVRNEKFYLLDKDLEIILSDAGLEPIEGNSLLNSLGISTMYPDRYGDFRQRALSAINDHIKHSGSTDSTGKASINGIEPNSYYLFGIVRTGQGFAVWSSPVVIQAGQNVLTLTPQRITEIEDRSGEYRHDTDGRTGE
jgi:hypothetical protein